MTASDRFAVTTSSARWMRLFARAERVSLPVALSPCPGLELVLACSRRPADRDLLTSSDSLNLPLIPRPTWRLSVPLSINLPLPRSCGRRPGLPVVFCIGGLARARRLRVAPFVTMVSSGVALGNSGIAMAYTRTVIKKVKARFIEPMLLLKTDALPDQGERWAYQLKVDGYRAIAFKSGGTLHLRSRNDNDFTVRYPGVLKGLAKLPNETVIDGELVAFDDDGGRRSTRCRTTASAATPHRVLRVRCADAGRPRRHAASRSRCAAICSSGRSCRSSRSRCAISATWTRSLPDLIASVKAQGFEGLVAKRRDSRYEPGLRSGAWQKMRVNRGQEFVIGGYTVGAQDVRRAHLRLLRRRPADLRGAHAQRVHAGRPRAA